MKASILFKSCFTFILWFLCLLCYAAINLPSSSHDDLSPDKVKELLKKAEELKKETKNTNKRLDKLIAELVLIIKSQFLPKK